MDSLPPIPTPPGQRWREFRIQVVPGIMFLCILVSVVFLWRNFVQPVGVVGEVEAVKATVTSLGDGLLAELTVDRFEKVTNSQPIGKVVQADPDLLKASLAAIETDLKVMRARMSIDERQREQDYQQLRFDLLDQKVALATARVNLIQASNVFQRASLLYLKEVDSEAAYDLAKAQRDALQAEVEERGSLIKDLTETLQRLLLTEPPGEKDPIEEAIKAKELELEMTMKPTVLKAPIDGVVGLVYRRAGEKVIRGEPILTISSSQSDRIVAYIRQPIPAILPTTNDIVLVRTRSFKRQTADAQILKVGAQMEPINPALLSTDSNRLEVGLPILVSLPLGLRLLPGEFVDISIRSSKK